MQEPRGYTFHGRGRNDHKTRSIFSESGVLADLEQETQTEMFDDVQAHLDELDFTLQQDRVLAPHELLQLEHTLMEAKRKMEEMRRNPMVTNQLVNSIEIKYNMLRQLLDEHYAGNVSDSVHVLHSRQDSRKAA